MRTLNLTELVRSTPAPSITSSKTMERDVQSQKYKTKQQSNLMNEIGIAIKRR